MARLAQFVFICVICIGAVAQNESPSKQLPIDRQHTAWIDQVLRAIQTIKPGMTRSDLAKLFRTEGGLSTVQQSAYVYRQCPHIKVDVKFAASGIKELPTDRIVEVSPPYLYLAWSVMD